jgi:hypothetical protein
LSKEFWDFLQGIGIFLATSLNFRELGNKKS